MINNNTRNYKRKIDIKKSLIYTMDLCEELNEDLFDNLFVENNGELNDETLQLTIENVNKLNLENNDAIYENKKLLKKKSESSTSCCSSRTSNTEESEEESGEEESGEEESGEESGEEESEDETSETESL